MSNDQDYYRNRARYVKSRQLAEHFHAKGYSLQDVQGMHPSLRAHHAKLAGVHPPSEETWMETINHMGAIKSSKERLSKYQPEDPFEGLS